MSAGFANPTFTTIPPFDAQLVHGGTQTIYISSPRTAANKATALASAFSAAVSGDTVYVGPGLFDFGYQTYWNGIYRNVVFPDHVTITGMGSDVTTLFGSTIPDNNLPGTPGSGGNVQFDMQNNVINNMTIDSLPYTHYPVGEDDEGVTLGYSGIPGTAFSSTINNCKIKGTEWTYYTWNNDGSSTVFNNCQFIGGRMGLSLMSSNPNTQYADLYNCTIDIDASRSNHVGATGDINYAGVFGVVIRGGRIRIYNSSIKVVNRLLATQDAQFSWTHRAAAITDQFHQTAGAIIELHNVTTAIDPSDGDPTLWGDLDFRTASTTSNLVLIGGTGAGGTHGNGQILNSFITLALPPLNYPG